MGYLAARLGKDQPTEMEREHIIVEIRKAILLRCCPTAIIVFGSILGDGFTHASDVDCAIIFQDRAAREQARKRLYSPPSLLELPYDLLLYEATEFAQKADLGGICQVIQETGRVVYDQKSKI